MTEENDEYLEHYGVKGMRWGHRKKEDTGDDSSGAKDKKASLASTADVEKFFGAQSSAPTTTGGSSSKKAEPSTASASDVEAYFDFAKTMQKELADNGIDSEDLKSKYGPQDEANQGGLTPTQKKLLIGAGIGLAGAAAVYYVKKNGLADDALSSKTLFKTRHQVYRDALKSKSNGLDLHWENGVDLPKGHIFKRVSSVMETEIRPEGFYAAFDSDDVDRYKAVLPTFWGQWGVGSPEAGGFVNNYRANAGVKAPSGKETLDIFKEVLTRDTTFQQSLGLNAVGVQQALSNEKRVRELFSAHAQMWAVSPTHFMGTQNRIFFSEIKKRGYNALIDFNDAGTLSKTPLRTLDGSMFDIVGNEPLAMTDMLAAAVRVKEQLAHALIDLYNYLGYETWSGLMHEEGIDPDEYLAHYGVKGMRWGHRKDPVTGVLAKTSREAKKDAQEFARAKMFYGQGAGTRRKLINASVAAKSAKDADYKRAFDTHLANQDMAQHASKARGERRRKDVTSTTAKTARGVKNILTGSIAPVTLTAMVVAGVGKSFVDSGGLTKVMNAAGNTKLADLKNHQANMRIAQNLLRNMGM